MATGEEERNTAVVLRNYKEIWNQRRYEVAEEIVAADFQDHPPTRFFDIGRVGPASLQEASRKFHRFFRVQNGKIVEHWGIPDLLGLLIQIGVIPPPPAESAKGSVEEQA